MVMPSATELAATLWCQEPCPNFHLGKINDLLVVVGEIALVLSSKPIPPPKKEEKTSNDEEYGSSRSSGLFKTKSLML